MFKAIDMVTLSFSDLQQQEEIVATKETESLLS